MKVKKESWKLKLNLFQPSNEPEKERIQNAGGSVMIQRVNGSLAVSRYPCCCCCCFFCHDTVGECVTGWCEGIMLFVVVLIWYCFCVSNMVWWSLIWWLLTNSIFWSRYNLFMFNLPQGSWRFWVQECGREGTNGAIGVAWTRILYQG